MTERTGIITLMGNPLTLVGQEIKEGDQAPAFSLVATDLSEAKSETYFGKPLLLLSVPSLDTNVCDIEARRFNEKAGELGDKANIVVVSMDLPFAQKRWADDKGVKNIVTLSDHREASFGMSYGVLIKEIRLLARVVFAVDQQGKVVYRQVVQEIANEPNYDAAIDVLRGMM